MYKFSSFCSFESSKFRGIVSKPRPKSTLLANVFVGVVQGHSNQYAECQPVDTRTRHLHRQEQRVHFFSFSNTEGISVSPRSAGFLKR